MAQLENHLFLRVDNAVGKMTEITGILKEASVNINSLITFSEGSQGIFVLSTSNNTKAKAALEGQVKAMHEMPIVLVMVPDKVGAFHDVAKKISDAGISIEWACATTTGEAAAIILTTSDNARAAELV